MPCPHRSGSSDRDDDADDSRREFLKAAVAIGGTTALSACAQRVGRSEGTTTTEFPQGPDALSSLPERQHAWADSTAKSKFGTPVFPQHQAFVFLDYVGEGPTETEQEQVETALRSLERAYQRGTGDDSDALRTDGLLFTIGYAKRYFERVGGVPERVDLRSPAEVLRALDDDAAKADQFDAVLHLASGHAQIVLAVEEALLGDVEAVNGHSMAADFRGVFERADRRTGAVGRSLPHRNIDERIPERSPTSMGFKSSYADTFPSEDRVTIDAGPFAGGTTQQISRLAIDTDQWYDEDHSDRVEKMFSPEHSPEEVGTVGDVLGASSGVTSDIADRTREDARERGRVGHAQKTARARTEGDFTPRILRRGDFSAPDEEGAVLHFGSIQRSTEDFVKTRRAMEALAFGTDESAAGDDVPELPPEDDGILGFTEVENRATFLVPPRRLRALPPSEPNA
jgi:hypothetical protein